MANSPEYYDLLGWGLFARNAAVRLDSFFRLRGNKPKTILDLACGTGELESKLSRTGIKFTGVDISPGMIKAAKKKFPQGKFIVGDAAKVRLGEKFDMVLLLFDSANHMRSLSHLDTGFPKCPSSSQTRRIFHIRFSNRAWPGRMGADKYPSHQKIYPVLVRALLPRKALG